MKSKDPNTDALPTSPLVAGRRSITVLVGVAVVSLAAGVGLSQLIKSPMQVAAELAPPTASAITVPVELREIANAVTVRADVGYQDPFELTVNPGSGGSVVTGHIPQVGTELAVGQVALEVVGRPVIVLPGELPAYRDLRAGMSGPDVVQLRQALASVGISTGNTSNDTYDATLARGVATLFSRAGYSAPDPDEGRAATLKAAQADVTSAQQNAATARRTLDAARRGASQINIVAADGAVATAQARLAYWDAECPKPPADRDPTADLDCTPPGRVALLEVLNNALAGRRALSTPPDTAEAQAVLTTANTALADARTALTQAQNDSLTPLLASEVVFIPTMPVRVDETYVRRGSQVDGAFATVSGATFQATSNVAVDDADLLTVGAAGTMTVQNEIFDVAVLSITSATLTDDQGNDTGRVDPARRKVVFSFGDLTTDQQVLLGYAGNVRVRIPVSSTDGKVLAVPLAALSAGPDGTSRVEVKDGTSTRLVPVKTGLAAGGYVEITWSQEPLREGELVVVDASLARDAAEAGQ
ncbi:MAG: hypothetical protein FWD18_01475 [Micrococcales bacterium]|nr:hypothetical protein [Micrococcales bacterium]